MTLKERIILYSALLSAFISVGSFLIYPYSPLFGVIFMVCALMLMAYILNTLFEKLFGYFGNKGVNLHLDEYLHKLISQEESLKQQRSAILNVLSKVEKEKDQIAEERDKINTILHSIADGVCVADKDNKVTLFNETASGLTGFSKEDAKGARLDSILKIVDNRNQEVLQEFLKKAQTLGENQQSLTELFLINKAGRKIPVSFSISPIKDNEGKVVASVIVLHDLTKEQEINKAKMEFISMASHQLRTPLSTINWYTEMLIAGDMGKLSKEQQQALQEIHLANQRTLDLVNSLLNMSRIELGTLEVGPEFTNLPRQIEAVISELTPEIKAKEIKIKKEYDEKLKSVIIDSKLFRIILENLLSNAIKYSHSGGKIIIKIKVAPSENIILSVKDFGYGIPEADQPYIFSKLFRAKNAKVLDPDGNGLGLYIVKSIADKTGLKVWFTSEENVGSEFFVEIPKEGMRKN